MMEEKLEAVKKDTSIIDERNNQLSTQAVQLENQKQEQAAAFAQAEQQKRDELEPMIREKQDAIAKLKEEIERDAELIKKTDD